MAIVGERFFAAEFDVGDQVDGRLDVNVEFRPVTVPGDIRQRLFALMDALQLN